jgi:hydroxyethylthiazole kinase-like uncharacterized protein yjeF
MTLPTALLTAAEMDAIEASCMARGGGTGAALMARAADGVVAAIRAQTAFATPGRAVVVCGPGNNGGDGYAVACRLHDAGWMVTVLALGRPGQSSPDAAAEAAAWAQRGPVGDFAEAGARIEADLAIDALFGTGLSRPLDPALARAWAARIAVAHVVAVDAPSGLCVDTGRDLGVVARADLTVTFHRAKLGHHVGIGPDLCGDLVIADIGCTAEDDAAAGPPQAVLVAPDAGALGKAGGAHKYDHGHALVLAGGVGRGGAARLAARAALRIGAGLVTVGVPGAALIENAARLDAVMLRRMDDADALSTLLADDRINAVVLGPGLGVGARTRALCAAVPEGRGVVLDADALSSFAESPPALWPLLRDRRVVLTPHAGEFARLFPDLAGFPDGRPAAVRAAAARADAVVLLKGRDTLIASPDGPTLYVAAATYAESAPWLATAGSGDVLAGIIGGLLARVLAPLDAAAQAAWLHAAAARAVGPGLIAEDLPEALPGVLRGLGV